MGWGAVRMGRWVLPTTVAPCGQTGRVPTGRSQFRITNARRIAAPLLSDVINMRFRISTCTGFQWSTGGKSAKIARDHQTILEFGGTADGGVRKRKLGRYLLVR